MLRPRGKASRIHKEVFSVEGKMPKKKQGYSARLDESLGEKDKKKKTKQSLKSRRDESKAMEKSIKRRSYASVESMDKARKKKR